MGGALIKVLSVGELMPKGAKIVHLISVLGVWPLTVSVVWIPMISIANEVFMASYYKWKHWDCSCPCGIQSENISRTVSQISCNEVPTFFCNLHISMQLIKGPSLAHTGKMLLYWNTYFCQCTQNLECMMLNSNNKHASCIWVTVTSFERHNGV